MQGPDRPDLALDGDALALAEPATVKAAIGPGVSPQTRSRLWLPGPGLAGCVRAVMLRDTRGAPLTEAQRFNFFPASPLCCLTWWFEGEAELLPAGAVDVRAGRQPLTAVPSFSGPFSRPLASWNPGAQHAMMVMLLPDALHRLTGLAVDDWVNRIVPVEAALPPDWQAMAQAVQQAASDAERLPLLQAFLKPRWQAQRAEAPLASAMATAMRDWTQALALRVAMSGPGRSLRQFERRIKRWAGLPLRDIRSLTRAEAVFFASVEAAASGDPDWAAMAAAAGYADQSHLCRETRRVTGFSPEALYRHILNDEAFWAYRLWR